MIVKERYFIDFCLSPRNKPFLIGALLIGIIYFITLRFIYPVPSYYADSFTWVGAAATGQPVTFRPIGYSKLLMFLHFFSKSDVIVVAVQYFSNLLANLFIFFTLTWFFKFRRTFIIILYAFLILNPFYLFYSNYISSDAVFNSLTVLWFTLLIWILHKPAKYNIALQVVVLAAAFEIRYNAIFFPAIAALVILFSKCSPAKKIMSILCTAGVIALLYLLTTYQTKKFTGTQTFSAFSGWQLANDALHIVTHDKVDSSKIKDKEAKHFLSYTIHYFDTTQQRFPDTAASAFFMWYYTSPLKKYIEVYRGRNDSYFKTWNALGPIYAAFGTEVIMQKPFTYLRYFVIPNCKAYFLPPLEIYQTYMENRDTIPKVVTRYFHYRSAKTPKHYPLLYSFVFFPMKYVSMPVNFLLPLLSILYFATRKHSRQSGLFNYTLISLITLYITNFFFIVLLAPSVFRYHVFIFTLVFPISLYLLQEMFFPYKRVTLVKTNR